MIKSTLVDSAHAPAKPFPKLMQSATRVVLFKRDGDGTVITTTVADMGNSHNQWDMEEFKDFEGSVELRNE